MNARVALVDADQAPLLVRHLYEGGDPGVIARALATVPELAVATLPFVGAALGPGALPADIKEMAIFRTSAVLECRYCVDTHTVVAWDMGFTPAMVTALRDTPPGQRPPGLDERQAAAVAWIDALAVGRGTVDDQTWAAVSSVLADHQVVELTVTVGATMFLNRLCTSLALPTSPQTQARLAAAAVAP
ncbi:MAG: carboxymuconolactone decarboxylase family protein [Actinomycetota bacterium]